MGNEKTPHIPRNVQIHPETWEQLRIAAALESIERNEPVSRSTLIREAARNYARRILETSTQDTEKITKAHTPD